MRAPVVLSALLIAACGSDPPPPTETPEPAPVSEAATPTEAADVAAPTPTTGTALHKDIIAAATSAKGVEKLKLRTDANGAVVKQALYHTDASKVPDAVKALASKEIPGKAVRYENEVYSDLGQIFEVEIQAKNGKRCEVAAKPDGTLRYKECRVKPKELPVEVTRKLGELHPKGKILEAETKKGPEVDEITVELKDGDRELYIRLKADGTVLGTFLRVPAIVEVPL